MSFWPYISSLFRDVIIGDPVVYGLLLALILLVLLFVSRTPLEIIISFMILPVYAIKELGYLTGPLAMSVWALIVIMAGFVFFKNIRNVMGG